MGSKQRKRVSSWKVARRCVVFFTTICVIPVLLVLLVTKDQYMRSIRENRINFVQPQIGQTFLPQFHVTKNMSLVVNRLETRKDYLKKTCKNLGLDIQSNDTLHRPNAWEFLYNKEHHLVWCNVFKAASTSWMYNFNILAGYSPQFLNKTKSVPLNLARQRYPRLTLDELKKAFNESVSFLIVRHPLERLLSAYRDKLEHSLANSYHKKLGNEIIVKYRPSTGKTNKQRWPSFQEFVMFLLDAVKNGDILDMHWTPITEFCTPCMFDFEIIAHMETLKEDQEYLIYKTGLQDIIKPEWRNSGKGATAQQIEKYYAQLTRAQILQLYHIYRYDFELFNYTLTGYLEVGQLDQDPSALLEAISMKETFNH